MRTRWFAAITAALMLPVLAYAGGQSGTAATATEGPVELTAFWKLDAKTSMTSATASPLRRMRGKRRFPRPRHGILLAFALGMSFWLARAIPREIPRWYLAAAMESHLDGDLLNSFRFLDLALNWNPEDASLYCIRGQLRLDAGRFDESLADCNRAIERSPQDVAGYYGRSLVCQRLKRHQDAIRDWNIIVDRARQAYATIPNEKHRRD